MGLANGMDHRTGMEGEGLAGIASREADFRSGALTTEHRTSHLVGAAEGASPGETVATSTFMARVATIQRVTGQRWQQPEGSPALVLP